jgi:anti-sigma factor RsiW
MSSMRCDELLDAAPEFALGNLCGDERAAVVEHLEHCPSCQQTVSSFTAVSDRLLLLAPRAEPPFGFEERVLRSMNGDDDERPTAVSRRPGRVALVALAACLALVVAVFSLGRSTPAAFATADMRTTSGAVVGQVYVRRASPTVVVMTLPGWADQWQRTGWTESYSVRVEHTDGQTEDHPVELGNDATVAMTIGVAPDIVKGVALVDSQGYVLCEAALR